MGKSKISYADYSWNPVVGCTPIASGCQFCWAKQLHDMRYAACCSLDGGNLPVQYKEPFSKIQIRTDRLEDPLHWKKPRTIFVNSMSDTFHKDVPFQFINRMWDVMDEAAQHTYLIFTKRPRRALEFFGDGGLINDHIYFFVSASTQAEVDEAVPILSKIPAAVRGLSLEPLIASVKLKPSSLGNYVYVGQPAKCIDRIIVGCESGPNRRPCKLEWIQSIVKQCQDADVKVYVKQLDIDGKVVNDMIKFPDDLKVRNF